MGVRSTCFREGWEPRKGHLSHQPGLTCGRYYPSLCNWGGGGTTQKEGGDTKLQSVSLTVCGCHSPKRYSPAPQVITGQVGLHSINYSKTCFGAGLFANWLHSCHCLKLPIFLCPGPHLRLGRAAIHFKAICQSPSKCPENPGLGICARSCGGGVVLL